MDPNNSPVPPQKKRQKRRSPVIKAGGYRFGTEDSVAVEDYTLGDRREVSTVVLGALKTRHQKMLLSLESRLSMFLRAEVCLRLEDLCAAKYRKVAGEVDEGFHLSLFRADSATGAGFLGCSTTVALAAVNLLLGGGGNAPNEGKALTKIEADLFAEVASEILDVWRTAWGAEMEFDPQVFQQEQSVRNFTQCDALTAVFHAKLSFKVGEAEGRACLVFPVHMIEAVVRRIEETGEAQTTGGRSNPGQWSAVYRNVPVRGDVCIDAGRMTVREFLELESGSVIPLQHQAMESATMSLAGRKLFRGSYGVDEGRLALSLTHKIKNL